MVVSRSDSKRRKKEEVDVLHESPKRTKVHAQRKFAQGSHLNSPILTPVKDKDKTKYNGAVPTTELLPIKRPKTEQFVNFLVFRGSDMLPKSLEFFNEPSIPEPLAGEEDVKRDGASTSGGPSRATHRTSDKHGDPAGGVAKAEARNKSKSKSSTAAVQALKKKYQEQRMNKEKRSLTKLALKVKGKNMMRTRSAGPLEEKPVAAAVLQKKPARTSRLVTAVKGKTSPSSRKPVLRKHPVVVKRIPSKSLTRGGLRSGGGLPPGSDEGLRTERKPRKIIKMKASPIKKRVKKTAIASSLSDFSSDDDQPLVKKQRVMSKASILANRVTTRSRLMCKPSTSQTTSARPPRKTKEAATLFMEMLKKDLRSPDEEEDNGDTMSVDSYGDSPKRTERRGSKDSTETVKIEKKSLTKSLKKETKPNQNKLPVKNNRKLPDKPVSRLTCLKTRTLRRNSYRLVAKEIELKRLKTTRAKLMSRMPSRSSSKDMSHDISNEVDKNTPKVPSSNRDNRRERRSNASKTPENKSKQHKAVTKENDLSPSKVSKKKSVETTFDDSDDEPLGKKVNQNNSISTSKGLKKSKPTSEKEDTSNVTKAEVVEQKLTRRRSLNTIQDSLKEDFKQSAQSTVRAQQAAKCSIENENSGKVKPEPTTKLKTGENNSGTINPKSKQLGGSTNETSTNMTQKLKDTEKNSVQNKIEIEKKGKKSVVKGFEKDDTFKSHEDDLNIEKKQHANKSLNKTDSKKILNTKGYEGDSNNSFKDVAKVSPPKISTDNIAKNGKSSALKTSKETLEISNSLSKNMSKKNVTTSSKGAGNAKNKNESPSTAASDKSNICDTGNSTGIKLPEPKKVSVKRSDQITISKECPLDSINYDENCKSKTKLVPENASKTMQTKTDKIEIDKSTLNSSRNRENTTNKQPRPNNNSVNDCFIVDNSQETKVEASDKDGIKKCNEISKSSLNLKGDLGEVSISNPTISGKLIDGNSCQESTLSKNINEGVTVDDSLNSIVSQVVIPVPKVYSLNNSQKQTPTSSVKGKSNEKAKGENLRMAQKVSNTVDSTTKPNKANLVQKPNEEDSIKLSSKSENSFMDIIGDSLKTKNVLYQDSNNRLVVTDPTTQSQVIGLKLSEVSSCSKSLKDENEQHPVTNVNYSGGTTLFTNITNSNNCALEKNNSEHKQAVVSKEVYSVQVTQPFRQQPTTQQFSVSSGTFHDEKFKIRNVVLEPILSKNLHLEGKCLPLSPALVSSDFKGKITQQPGYKETAMPTRDFKTDGKKIGTKEESFIDNTSKLESLDMSDKVSSAIETLMSLKNVQKIDDKSFAIQSGVWNVKSGQTFDVEPKRVHETELKRINEADQKHFDTHDNKKIKIKEGEVKRVTIQEPEFKRFSIPETDTKRPNLHENDFRRYHIQDPKPKLEHPQVLKGCSNPKSMLKPGTLIDIAGISHSPEIMTPLRPGVDGEIIPMNKPIRPFGQESADPFKASVQGFKPYEPRVESSTYGYRWQSPITDKNLKPDQLSEKEANDSKSKTSVNESAWRLAFKNVKDPKGSNNVPTEKPVAKKQLSVTALAKKHKSKTEIVSDKNTQSQSSTPIPFLRHNKPFLGPSPKKTKEAGSTGSDVKKSSDVDPASLREKEAEVEEFLRQCGSRSLAPSVTLVNPSLNTKTAEDMSRSDSVKSPYLPSRNDSVNTEELTVTHSEQMLGNQQPTSDVKYTPKKQSHHDQSDSGSLFATSDGVKRAGSPLKLEKRQIQTVSNSAEMSPINKNSLSAINSQQEQVINKQTSSVCLKQDQSLNIFQIDSIRRSNSPKSLIQKSASSGIDTKTKSDDSSFSSSSNTATTGGEQVMFLGGTQQTGLAFNTVKQPLPDKVRRYSPNRSSQGVVSDNLFRESNLTKRTKSPTLMDSYSQQNSSPKGNSISRNTNSPVFGKCSTTNIFKEIVPAKRSYSPTLISTSQSDSETVPNVFSQNQNFRRSVSPLSNRSGFPKLGPTSDNNIETAKKPREREEKKVETSSDDIPYNMQSNVSTSTTYPIKQQTNSLAVNSKPQPSQLLQSNKPVNEECLVVKEEVAELDETKNSNLIAHEDSNSSKLDIKPFIQGGSENLSSSHDIESGQVGLGMSEAKHRLPLPVEQTLKKLGQTRSPQNKKPPLPQKLKSFDQNIKNIQSHNEDVQEQGESSAVEVNLKETQNVFAPKLATGIYSHNQEGELDLMQKKKVNMSAEEIKRWLNDSSTSEVEHRANCGILENDTCECEYRNTLAPSLQNIDTLKFETVSKSESISLNKPVPNQLDVIETTRKTVNSQVELPTPEAYEVRHSFGVKEKEEKDALKEIKKEDCNLETTPFLKQETQRSAISSNKNTTPNQLKEEGLVSIKNFCVPVSVGTSASSNIKQPPTTPPVSKLRTFRLPNKNVDIEQKTPTSDILDISTPARDDASSSNDLSSSNEETPEKSHERKSIFHQRRSTLKVKERRELLAPSVNAFSPENESSVYAFDPELPPTSTPFRRSKGKDGKSTSTTTDDEELTPSSNSIAVQVNFDNEAVLECSTQTDVQEGEDDDTHTFYIPLQQSAADTSKPPLIQGVAVKVDTEGPDQKVIMRAKLVTKPLSTFNQSSSSPRGLIGTRLGKPEQKVRPLSVKPPVGTVQPTARPKPKPVATQDDQPGPSKSTTTCSPQAARLAKRIKSKAAVPSTSAENHPPKVPPAKLVEAPTFYPTEKEFEDPLEYISSITPQAEKYGLCRVVPPTNFKPECKVSDDMRFTAYNQYIHKMLHRWGPNVKEMLAIKKYLATQSIALTHPPWIGGMEVDLPRLYQTVQQCGGLKEVIEKKRWHRVADAMKIPKSAQDRVTKLDDIYCKFLLPYDTLSHVERTQLFEGVEQDWIEREKRVANQQESSATDEDEDSDSDSDSDIDECIVKGRSMALNGFYRIARNTMSMWFPKTDTPSAADVELEFWKHVASRQHHVCVHSGSIDSGAMGYGFPTGKNSSTSRHPWNLKMLTNNPGSILRFLGPIMGVTVPTLHVGMLFSACCWYRDPHGLPWIEYLHTGASKIWYGIPDSSSSQFRDAVMSIVPRLCRDKTLWLASDTAMVPPPLLVEKGVSLSRIVQDPGQFIIVFPKAFTSSICTGYLVSESVYFAQPSWLSTAQALFNDMRESSEPTVFSLEKLLFTIVNDTRASIEVLNQILSIVVSLRDGEVAGRRQLEELGLNTSERLNSKRRGKARPASDGEEDLECDECRMTLFISWMSNSQDGFVYCLPHAVELLSNKRSLVKHCTLVYAFSEEELEELVEKLKSRVENKTQKKSVAKSSKS